MQTTKIIKIAESHKIDQKLKEKPQTENPCCINLNNDLKTTSKFFNNKNTYFQKKGEFLMIQLLLVLIFIDLLVTIFLHIDTIIHIENKINDKIDELSKKIPDDFNNTHKNN